jgi:hypothetical protein
MCSAVNLEQHATAFAHSARSDDCAQRARDPALPPDDLTDVVGRHVEANDEHVVAILLLDPNCIRVVHELSCEERDELGQPMFLALSNRETAFDGCAPLPSHSRTFVSSNSIVDGSV